MAPRTPLVLLLWLCSVAPRAAAPTGAAPPHLSGTGHMWHITDLHLDLSYHLDPDPAHVCASSRGSRASAPGVFGDYLCDAPYRLLLSALQTLGAMVAPDDFVIWTGDSPPHVPVSQLSTDLVIEVLTNLTMTIKKNLPPNVTVFPALGNHDYWPQDQMPGSSNAVYKAAAQLWAPWLQEEALQTLAEGGFYSQLVRPGLRLVSLNTVLYYGPDQATANASDPAGQYGWLQGTLQRAQSRSEKVLIIAHVPVGFLPFAWNTTAMRREHSERLAAIFLKFSHVIIGQFYGHTHRDSVTVQRDHTGSPVNVVFVAPAVTPIRNIKEPTSNNPGFRVYLLDQDHRVQDLVQWYLNLTEANLQQRALWRVGYVMTLEYGLKDLSPDSVLDLGLRLVSPLSRTFRTYFTHFNVEFSPELLCVGLCHIQQVCAVLHLDLAGYQDCV